MSETNDTGDTNGAPSDVADERATAPKSKNDPYLDPSLTEVVLPTECEVESRIREVLVQDQSRQAEMVRVRVQLDQVQNLAASHSAARQSACSRLACETDRRAQEVERLCTELDRLEKKQDQDRKQYVALLGKEGLTADVSKDLHPNLMRQIYELHDLDEARLQGRLQTIQARLSELDTQTRAGDAAHDGNTPPLVKPAEQNGDVPPAPARARTPHFPRPSLLDGLTLLVCGGMLSLNLAVVLGVLHPQDMDDLGSAFSPLLLVIAAMGIAILYAMNCIATFIAERWAARDFASAATVFATTIYVALALGELGTGTLGLIAMAKEAANRIQEEGQASSPTPWPIFVTVAFLITQAYLTMKGVKAFKIAEEQRKAREQGADEATSAAGRRADENKQRREEQERLKGERADEKAALLCESAGLRTALTAAKEAVRRFVAEHGSLQEAMQLIPAIEQELGIMAQLRDGIARQKEKPQLMDAEREQLDGLRSEINEGIDSLFSVLNRTGPRA